MKKSKNIRISSRQELEEIDADSNNLKLGVTDLGWVLIDIGLASEEYSGLPSRYKNYLSLMLIETRERGRFWDAMRMIEDYAQSNGYSGVVLRAESQSSLIDQDNLEKLYRRAGYREISSDYIDFGDYDEDEAAFYAKDSDIIDGVISKISFRQKTAGKREAKKVSGLNFEEIKKRLISEGIDPTPDEIKAKMADEGYLVISEKQKNTINSIDISESQRKRVNEVESALIVIGAVLSNESEFDAKSDIEIFEWYLETFELKPGDLGISDGDIKDIISIKKVYEKIYSKISDEKSKSDELASATSDDDYLSNEVVYDLGEGWRVAYVPAAGEMEPYPGYPDTSHDRVLEGNKNGLCLGSGMRLYQSNKDGKIYSVRDPSNKPRVTIRILDNILKEAKGKNNNPPDVLAAIKADTWFKAADGLSYKKSHDYRLFPPLNIEDARKSFFIDSYSAYTSGWVPQWYNNGIKEIDEDVEKKIENLDKKIIMGGFGKYPKFFDRAKPVVIHWCNKYLNGDIYAEDIIFGFPEIHEIYKTYKKLPEMQLAVKKLSESEKAHKFIELNLHKIKEYEQYIKNFAENFISKKSLDFLERYSEEPWAQPYLDFAAKNSIKKNPFIFLGYFSDKPWAQPYLDFAAKNIIKEDPYNFVEKFSDKSWAQPYLTLAVEILLENDPEGFLEYYSYEPWAQPYIDLAKSKLKNKEASNSIQAKLLKLSRFLKFNNLEEYKYLNYYKVEK